MALRLTLWLGSLGCIGYLAVIGFESRDAATQKVLVEKGYEGSLDERKKRMILDVLKGAAGNKEAIYQKSKEEIEKSLTK